ncbi:hypothetical protein A2765_02040 [Candidatus Kaiserbacteria bacterium RIFCSPHIGHO2_01_FULL_56_24]|uniref:Uncharacterized protein n=1 Tax=Candidatus Kaiserbacteria bacterium RIFCSPHIGHO2_01_FULL_56_24 TaxID=1798487 RepID=A0A1F6DAU4_9BACT|nr:MAG: hypothetical protein A2765_02040 [Candidatus Kaiserbacteria bacterium RIFCSPHIGHO2_01_FULL_56_24]
MKILYALVGLVVISVGAWLVLGQKGGAVETISPGVEASDLSSSGTMEFNGSLQQLMARSGSWQCEYAADVGGTSVKGTTYISGGKIRSDILTTIPQLGRNVDMHMILLGNTAYTWNSMSPQGMKITMNNGQANAGAGEQAWAQFNQQYGYMCKSWATDESKFTLPSGITF